MNLVADEKQKPTTVRKWCDSIRQLSTWQKDQTIVVMQKTFNKDLEYTLHGLNYVALECEV